MKSSFELDTARCKCLSFEKTSFEGRMETESAFWVYAGAWNCVRSKGSVRDRMFGWCLGKSRKSNIYLFAPIP